MRQVATASSAPFCARRTRSTRGLTLVELLVVLAIMAILASMAAPSFNNLIASAHVSRASNSFIADIRFARGEGMRRGKNVSICRTAVPSAAAPVCSTGNGAAGGGWMQGWVVFVDEDGDGSFEAGDSVLRVQEALSGLSNFYAVNTAGLPMGGQNFSVFDATGRAVGFEGRWLVRPAGVSSAATDAVRTLCVNSIGRVRVLRGEVPCS